ncbi:MAG: tol-pal system protein YbgF [Kofleriaceae bacterium]
MARSPLYQAAVLSVYLTFVVGAGCGGASRSALGARPQSAEELSASVERLRVERRHRERKIRELERQLAARGASERARAEAAAQVPSLPVEVLAPSPQDPEVRAAPRGVAPEGEVDALPGELTPEGERLVGIADDGSEIVYVDDAAIGRLARPSAETLAEMNRSQRAARPPRADAMPEIDEGDARALLDDAAEERLAPHPAPLAKIGRRAARSRPVSRKAPPVRGTDNGDAEVRYRAAVALVRRGEYASAIASFREFLRRHPSHDYSDNAQYWLGESFYAQRLYAQALAELRLVAERYPQGNKVPDSLLKVGYCHLAMGQRDQADAVLREVIRLFPASQPAALAEKKLQEQTP